MKNALQTYIIPFGQFFFHSLGSLFKLCCYAIVDWSLCRHWSHNILFTAICFLLQQDITFKPKATA